MKINSLGSMLWNSLPSLETGSFQNIMVPFGDFLYAGDKTRQLAKLDVACLLMRTKCVAVMEEDLEVLINGLTLKVKLAEDPQDSLRLKLKDYLEMEDSLIEES